MRRLAILTATALLLAGCTSGGDDSSSDGARGGDTETEESGKPSATRTTPVPTGPDCADVWKAGATLPQDYEQCLQDGEPGPQDETPCLDGTTLVIFDDALYAVTGGRIVEPEASPLQDTEEFGAAFSACTGEE
ncbi:hypothetical protein GEV27_08160 [Aeromicrobium sp. S22]|uniref:hypothetical protein n=1 Tax=Aeromicrobium sp. S22 TaxID=2662029 RepID=UPI00129DFEE7|nr:hypothetical protein [Aeromicrobium sp. S22]MRK01492.1 hypothetical protein [Aeromicrobium sp. S22]